MTKEAICFNEPWSQAERIHLSFRSQTEMFKNPSCIAFCFSPISPSWLLVVVAGAQLPHAPAFRLLSFSADLGLFCWYCYILFSSVENKLKKKTHTATSNTGVINMHFSFFLCCSRKGAAGQTKHDELPALLISTGSKHRCAAALPNYRMLKDEQSW